MDLQSLLAAAKQSKANLAIPPSSSTAYIKGTQKTGDTLQDMSEYSSTPREAQALVSFLREGKAINLAKERGEKVDVASSVWSSSSSLSVPEHRKDENETATTALSGTERSVASCNSTSHGSEAMEAEESITAPSSFFPDTGGLPGHTSTSSSCSRTEQFITPHIPGTGAFIFRPDEAISYHNNKRRRKEQDEGTKGEDDKETTIDQQEEDDGEWSVRSFVKLSAEKQKAMLNECYEAVCCVCNALVPGGKMELLDALVDTTDVYRKRYGSKKELFGIKPDGSNAEEVLEGAGATGPKEMVCLTKSFKCARGAFWLRKDRHIRKRRLGFTQLARSQRARVVKVAYELIQAVGEVFIPGGNRLELIDRVFAHHNVLRPRRHAPTKYLHDDLLHDDVMDDDAYSTSPVSSPAALRNIPPCHAKAGGLPPAPIPPFLSCPSSHRPSKRGRGGSSSSILSSLSGSSSPLPSNQLAGASPSASAECLNAMVMMMTRASGKEGKTNHNRAAAAAAGGGEAASSYPRTLMDPNMVEGAAHIIASHWAQQCLLATGTYGISTAGVALEYTPSDVAALARDYYYRTTHSSRAAAINALNHAQPPPAYLKSILNLASSSAPSSLESAVGLPLWNSRGRGGNDADDATVQAQAALIAAAYKQPLFRLNAAAASHPYQQQRNPMSYASIPGGRALAGNNGSNSSMADLTPASEYLSRALSSGSGSSSMSSNSIATAGLDSTAPASSGWLLQEAYRRMTEVGAGGGGEGGAENGMNGMMMYKKTDA